MNLQDIKIDDLRREIGKRHGGFDEASWDNLTVLLASLGDAERDEILAACAVKAKPVEKKTSAKEAKHNDDGSGQKSGT